MFGAHIKTFCNTKFTPPPTIVGYVAYLTVCKMHTVARCPSHDDLHTATFYKRPIYQRNPIFNFEKYVNSPFKP